jgi:hypothetical protein
MVSSAPAKPAAEKPVPAEKPTSADKPAPPPAVKQPFEAAFLDYVRAVYRTQADAQRRAADTYQAYQREIGEGYAELQKRFDDLQRDYVASIQEAFGRDDAAVRAEKAYQDMLDTYRQLVEESQRHGEHMNKKLAALLTEQGEEQRKQFADALQGYLRSLQGAVQHLDSGSVRVADLEYLSQSIGTVAAYAAATGTLAR